MRKVILLIRESQGVLFIPFLILLFFLSPHHSSPSSKWGLTRINISLGNCRETYLYPPNPSILSWPLSFITIFKGCLTRIKVERDTYWLKWWRCMNHSYNLRKKSLQWRSFSSYSWHPTTKINIIYNLHI